MSKEIWTDRSKSKSDSDFFGGPNFFGLRFTPLVTTLVSHHARLLTVFLLLLRIIPSGDGRQRGPISTVVTEICQPVSGSQRTTDTVQPNTVRCVHWTAALGPRCHWSGAFLRPGSGIDNTTVRFPLPPRFGTEALNQPIKLRSFVSH